MNNPTVPQLRLSVWRKDDLCETWLRARVEGLCRVSELFNMFSNRCSCPYFALPHILFCCEVVPLDRAEHAYDDVAPRPGDPSRARPRGTVDLTDIATWAAPRGPARVPGGNKEYFHDEHAYGTARRSLSGRGRTSLVEPPEYGTASMVADRPPSYGRASMSHGRASIAKGLREKQASFMQARASVAPPPMIPEYGRGSMAPPGFSDYGHGSVAPPPPFEHGRASTASFAPARPPEYGRGSVVLPPSEHGRLSLAPPPMELPPAFGDDSSVPSEALLAREYARGSITEL